MTATITKEEEELLIITDDDETTTEINLDTLDKKEPEVEGEVISFGGEEDSKNDKTEIESNIGSDELDFNFDLGGDKNNLTVEDMLGNKEDSLSNLKKDTELKEETISENSLDFNLEEDIDLEKNKEDIKKEKIIPELNNKEEVSEEVELDFNLEETKEDDILNLEETKEDDILNLEETKEDDILNLETVEIPAVIPKNIPNDNKKENKIDLKEKNKKEKNKKVKAISKNVIIEKEEGVQVKGDLDDGDDNKSSGKSSDDTNTILNETIKKLQARKKEIVDIKKETLDNISELKDEIKALQGKVRKANTEVKHYDKETEKIDENIKMLRKMKI